MTIFAQYINTEEEVEEITSKEDPYVNWCQLNLINARITDSGEYKVKFPINPAHDMNETITVKAASKAFDLQEKRISFRGRNCVPF